MLADRPALRMPSSQGLMTPNNNNYGSISSNNNGVTIDASGSIGNFKGVMLCNRPDAMEGVGRISNGEQPAFRVPSQHEVFHPNGQNTELVRLNGSRNRRPRAPNPHILKVKAYLQELADKKS